MGNNFIPYVYTDANHEKMVDIYSRMLDNRKIFLIGEINRENAVNTVTQLLYLDSLGTEQIDLYISSPGGSVIDGLSIIDTMKHVKSSVKTINIGMCASMAAWILASGDERCALENATTMIHQLSANGNLAGNIQDVSVSVEYMKKTNDKMLNLLASLSGKTKDEVENLTQRDYYMDNEKAVQFGIIDRIVK